MAGWAGAQLVLTVACLGLQILMQQYASESLIAQEQQAKQMLGHTTA